MSKSLTITRGRRRQPVRRRGPFPLVEAIVALLAVGLLGHVLIDQGFVDLPRPAALAGTSAQQVTYHFTLCSGPGGTCVIDGDTIRIDGTSIRIADIDTPEVRSYQCPEELALGTAATRRMLDLVNSGAFTLERWGTRDQDQYGRKLRVLMRDGQSLGMVLVAEGLARPWGGARESWCG